MGINFPVPISMAELGSIVSGTTGTILAAGSNFDFPILYIPTWLKHKVEKALLQINIPYIYNAHGADNWLVSGNGVYISPDDNAHSYQAIDLFDTVGGTSFRCQNGATSSLVVLIGTFDIGQYIEDAITYGEAMALAPHLHVNFDAAAHGDSIAFMLHSSSLKVYLRG